ncbi:hypothetical protein TWF730_001422 [Orbilia blumenaviensis]|uniref:NB-ARC domain-containing protein n=1 Tax=Orbilia blumenaviensis TaxID=1796055 RepID=A0AAV9UHP5_9PEZI
MRREDFTVGWICAVDIELSAARGVLDKEYNTKLSVPESDKNFYGYGEIGGHNVVFTCLPQMGITQAGIVATRMNSTFTNLRFVLMVGVGGGAPSKTNDIRLGDVVISKGAGRCSGVVQYDFGKAMENGEFLPTGWLNAPPQILISAASSLKARGKGKLGEDIWNIFTALKMKNRDRLRQFFYPGPQEDNLYEFDCAHARDENNKPRESCSECNQNKLVQRSRRPIIHPHIHYGIIASANEVMKDGRKRNEIVEKTAEWAGADPLCFEMEAAGLMNDFPCLVIRGICDYSDAHKNKIWQPYAAINAAIYARELLKQVSPSIRAGLVEDARETLNSVPTKDIRFVFQYSMPFHIPFSRNTAFTGRQDLLDEIHEYLKGSLYDEIPLTCAITGIGGMGKSQIAIEYAYQHLGDYGSVFWVTSTNEHTIRTSYVKIMECIIQEHARALWGDSVADYSVISRNLRLDGLVNSEGRVKNELQFISQIRSAVFRWLGHERPDNKKWLLILDGADNSDLCAFRQRPECLPSRGSGAILITTRRPDSIPEYRTKKVDLGGLDLDNSIKLLMNSARLETTEPAVRTHATAIVTELGFMPLAIAQAGYYILKEYIGLEAYIPLYQKNFLEVQGRKMEYGSNYPETAATTWEPCFRDIERRDEEAVAILLAAAYFKPDDISESIWLGDKDGRSDERTRIRFKKRLAILESYSLVRSTGRGVFAIHPVVQAWARARLGREEKRIALRDAIVLLGNASRWSSVSRDSKKWVLAEERRITSHIRNIGRICELDFFGLSTDEAKKPNNDNLYFALAYIGHLLEKQSRYSEAIPWFKEAIAGLYLQTDQLEILSALNGIGVCHLREEKYWEAFKRFEEGGFLTVVKPYLASSPPSIVPHEKICEFMNNMGLSLLHHDEVPLADLTDWYRRIYGWTVALGGGNVLLSVQVLRNGAKVYSRLKDFKTSESLRLDAISRLQLWRNNFAKQDDLLSYDATNMIGRFFEDRKMDEAAVEWYKDSLTNFGQGLPENHPHRVKTFWRMGKCLINQRKGGEAMIWCEKALAGFKELQGEDQKDRKYYKLLYGVADCSWGLERWNKAFELIQIVFTAREKLLGRRHPKTLEAMGDMSRCYLRFRDYEEALNLAFEAYGELKKLKYRDNYLFIETMATLAVIYDEKPMGSLLAQQTPDYNEALYWFTLVRDEVMQELGQEYETRREYLDSLKLGVTKKIEELQAKTRGTPAPAPSGFIVPGYRPVEQNAHPMTPPPTNQNYHTTQYNQAGPQGYHYAPNAQSPPCSQNAAQGFVYGQDPQTHQYGHNPQSPPYDHGQNQQTAPYNHQQSSYFNNPKTEVYGQQPGRHDQLEMYGHNQQPGGYNQQSGQYNQQYGAYNSNQEAYGPQGAYNRPYNQPPIGYHQHEPPRPPYPPT